MKISGNKVELARKQAGLSRNEIARAIGMTDVRAWQICTDEVSNVNDVIATVLAGKLGVPVEFIEASR